MRQLIRWHFGRISDGSATEDIFSKVVKAGKIAILTKISIKNKTTAYTLLEVGVDSMGILQSYEEEVAPQANVLYWIDKPLSIGEGERLQCKFTGLTSGDDVHVYAQGYMVDMEDFLLSNKPLPGLVETELGSV